MLRTEYVDVDYHFKLQKDLQEYEIVCPYCRGTGIQIVDNRYGIQGEDREEPFPYKQQSISFCQHCYNGVQKKCIYCGELLDRQSAHDCEGARKERNQKRYEKELETWNQVKKVSLEQAIKDYVMLYIDNSDEFINADELKEWLLDKEDENENVKLLRIYGTYALDLSIDASDIIEDACSDLHENAMDNISGEEELQAFLDKWCEKNQQGAVTYYADYKVGIQL